MIKVLTGPKEASAMALEVLSKVLTMSSDEHNLCLKKIKWSGICLYFILKTITFYNDWKWWNGQKTSTVASRNKEEDAAEIEVSFFGENADIFNPTTTRSANSFIRNKSRTSKRPPKVGFSKTRINLTCFHAWLTETRNFINSLTNLSRNERGSSSDKQNNDCVASYIEPWVLLMRVILWKISFFHNKSWFYCYVGSYFKIRNSSNKRIRSHFFRSQFL